MKGVFVATERDDVRNQSILYAFTEINNFLKTLQN